MSDEEAKALRERPPGPRLLVGLPEGTAAGGGASTGSGDENRLRTMIQTITLPALGVPEAIRRRSANRFVEDLIRAQGKGECEVIVPFADAHSPHVPVLSLCPGVRGIQFMRKVDDEWVATGGGWMTGKDILRRFVPLIRKHASLTVKP